MYLNRLHDFARLLHDFARLRIGRGWDKILAEHDEHPLKPEKPKIGADEYSFSVTIFSTKKRFEKEKVIKLNERQKKALEYIKEKGSITNKEYQEVCNTTKKTATRVLQDLVSKGVVLKKGITGRGVCYFLKSKGDIKGT